MIKVDKEKDVAAKLKRSKKRKRKVNGGRKVACRSKEGLSYKSHEFEEMNRGNAQHLGCETETIIFLSKSLTKNTQGKWGRESCTIEQSQTKRIMHTYKISKSDSVKQVLAGCTHYCSFSTYHYHSAHASDII